MPLDKAMEEVEQWLDSKRVREKKRDLYAENIEELAEAISAGDLRTDDQGRFVQKLAFPIGEGEKQFTELTYKTRVPVGKFHVHLKGVKADDVDGRIMAYVAGLTDAGKGIISQMDGVDYEISKAIAVFFL